MFIKFGNIIFNGTDIKILNLYQERIECFMKTCSKYTAQQLNDVSLSTYIGELEQKHTEIFNKFLNLL